MPFECTLTTKDVFLTKFRTNILTKFFFTKFSMRLNFVTIYFSFKNIENVDSVTIILGRKEIYTTIIKSKQRDFPHLNHNHNHYHHQS